MPMEPYEREHIARLRPLLAECAVLLRRNGDFPLAGPGEVALYGSGARRTVKGGTGSGEVNSRYFDSVERGLLKAGFTITSTSWLDGYDRVLQAAREEFRRSLRARARAEHKSAIMLALGATAPEPEYSLPLNARGDTAIYVLARNSGEGADRAAEKGDILLTDTERRDILALQKSYRRFLLVLNVGGPVDLSGLEAVENILLLSQLGVETGDALADMVLGKRSPGGRLTTTWQAWDKGPSEQEFGGCRDTRYREGIYVGYRWYDSLGQEVMFPFGYGLSYTDFALSGERVRLEGSRVTVSAAVKNTGGHPGREVVQVYVSAPALRLDQPFQSLAAWVKTPELAPGESAAAEASFDLSEIASYDTERSAWVLEAGDYIVRVGRHSRDTKPAAVLRLGEDVTLLSVRRGLDRSDFADFVPPTREPERVDAPVIELSAAAFSTQRVAYDRTYPIDPAAEALSDEELTLLSNGLFGHKGLLSMVGDSSKSVCGAAGETAHVRGLRPIIMADGPAGLRLIPRYFEDARGRHGMEPPFPPSMLANMPGAARFALERFLTPRPKKGQEVKTQFCTALPIGTAIAQSWDLALAETCGDIVGAEMERFGVDLWLAPALNIHRNIRCGRNFEYFSEDPLISGKMAAALSRGVQAHPGRGVTIKHFAANNQEFNRTSSNSIMSERAAREIYLRGFGIAVREGKPRAVMTSYNLLNGLHTALRRDLIEDILRCEFGFEGIVMTDWVVMGGMLPRDAIYPGPDAGDVAAAGGDLFMPGSRADLQKVRAALQNGRLTRQQLQINATRLWRFWEK